VNWEFELTGGVLRDQGQRSGFLLLAAFLVSFLFIRTSARLMRSPRVPWWPGSVETKGGVHIHHLVLGIGLLLVSGFLDFTFTVPSPWREVLAAAFGVGAGLTLDEFALLVYLRDVYWAREGRASLEAVVIATLLAGLVVLGIAPFDLGNKASIAVIALTALIVLVLSAVAILKGKLAMGLVGLFVPLVAIVGAVRLAKPGSPWARGRYAASSAKLERAMRRFSRQQAIRDRWLNRLGGAPSG
jgi:hypothetical protein